MSQSLHNRAEHKAVPEWVAKPERSNTFAIRIIAWVARTLGRRAARLFLYPIAAYFVALSPKANAASRKYLNKALGRAPTLGDVFRHYFTFAATVLDRVFLLSDRFGMLDVRVHGMERELAQLMERGCILLGAHIGSFEIIRAVGRRAKCPPVSMVMYEDNARKVNSVLHAINPALAQQVIELGKPGSMLKVRDALLRGELAGILADRVVEGEGSAVCEFLGERAKFSTGPLRTAAMLKAPVLLMVGIYRGGNRYDVYFEKLADMSGVEPAQRDAVVAQTLRAYGARLEHYCREAPYNWFNFFDFWR